jgi:MarR family transcriptional regulator for hemolysin
VSSIDDVAASSMVSKRPGSIPHPDQPLRLARLIGQIARQWRRAVDLELSPYGLTEATWLPLVRLARSESPMRQKDLAQSLSLDGSSVVRLLDTLEGAGLVTRTENAIDRRAKTLELTASGRRMVEQVDVVSLQVRDRVLAGVPPEDIDATVRTLDHICLTLGAMTDGVPA